MACEFFDDGRLARCTRGGGSPIPSHHERERYCRTDDSRRVPRSSSTSCVARRWRRRPTTRCGFRRRRRRSVEAAPAEEPLVVAL